MAAPPALASTARPGGWQCCTRCSSAGAGGLPKAADACASQRRRIADDAVPVPRGRVAPAVCTQHRAHRRIPVSDLGSAFRAWPVSYTHLRAHETSAHL
eukprot:4975956-Alexandrium_andersonii.AAC.1